jgi:hypothetical protein
VTCMSAGPGGSSRSLPSWDYPGSQEEDGWIENTMRPALSCRRRSMWSMHLDVAVISVLISFGALGTAIYGIFERGRAASRAERVRLTAIIENLAETRGKLEELVSNNVTSGNKIEVLHSRQELLAQQAISLIRKHELTITSTECRELAYNLEEIGFREDAEAIWAMALENAPSEGDTQAFFASRGFAWFLFRSQRETEARQVLQEALSKYPTESDIDRSTRAETLRIWAGWEIDLQGPGVPIAADLSRQISDLADSCNSVRGRAMVMRNAFNMATIQSVPPASDGHAADGN